MSIKDKFMSEGLKLASHPAISGLLKDERFLKLVMAALSVPGKLTELSEDQRANALRFLGAASQREIDDLKRAVRSLEEEVSRLRGR